MKNLGKRITASVLLSSVLCCTMPIYAFTKDETVYSNLDGEGNVYQTTVSDHLKNTEGESALQDLSDLLEITNVSGEQKLEKNGNSLIWEANGEDIYYQGKTEKELPIDCKITYTLDGIEVSREEIKGKTGRVKIKLEFANKEERTVKINGVERKMYVPFTVACGTVIDNENSKNIQITNGKVIDNGTKTMIFGIALPGMQESLGLSKSKVEIPNSVSIEMEAKDFNLAEIYIFVTPKILEDKDLEVLDELDEMYKKIDTLQSSSRSIEQGANTLAEGMNTLEEGLETVAKKEALDVQTLTQIGNQATDTAVSSIAKQKAEIGKEAASTATNTIAKQKDKIGKEAQSVAASTITKQKEQIGEQAASTATSMIAKQKEQIGEQAQSAATSMIANQKKEIGEQAKSTAQSSLKKKIPGIKKEASETALKEFAKQMKSKKQIEDEAISGIKAYLKANPTYEALYNTLDANQKKLFEESIKATAVSVANEAQTQTKVAIKQVAEGTAESVATQVAGEVASQTAENVADIVAGQVANQTAQTVAGTVASQVANQTAQTVAGTVASQVANQTAQTVAGTVASQVANQTAQTVAGTVAGEVANQTATTTAKTVANEVKNQVISGMSEGVEELSNGADSLAKGIEKFNREGIDTICNTIKGEVKDLTGRVEKLQDLANEYNNFTMVEENAQGSVKFIMMIDSLDKKRKN